MYSVAIVKLTSCSGCVNEVVYAFTFSDVISKYRIEYSTELTDVEEMREVDIAFVEGSITNKRQEELIKGVRSKARFIVAVGTCAIMGGVQSLRVGSDINDVKGLVYPEPHYIEVYSSVKPITDAITIDLAIPGCPINGDAVVSFLRKYALGGLPIAIYESVCAECKRRELECVMVAWGVPCLGPVTISGCRAICPSFGRGCYGCYGIKYFDLDKGKIEAFSRRLAELGMSREDVDALLKGYGFRVYSKITRDEET
uniref:NADH:ubiquinone oxidoreductase-like 20kDa subunit domain-containing protein n=1 Tax=Ignisphaera aggregans TaxID=334771 RepID=A0A7C4BCF6_9CREN